MQTESEPVRSRNEGGLDKNWYKVVKVDTKLLEFPARNPTAWSRKGGCFVSCTTQWMQSHTAFHLENKRRKGSQWEPGGWDLGTIPPPESTAARVFLCCLSSALLQISWRASIFSRVLLSSRLVVTLNLFCVAVE